MTTIRDRFAGGHVPLNTLFWVRQAGGAAARAAAVCPVAGACRTVNVQFLCNWPPWDGP
jgi:hypothetical protein